MEVQVLFMMIKSDMSFLCKRITILLCISVGVCAVYAQSYNQLIEKEKQCLFYESQGNWKEAANINIELVAIPDSLLSSHERRFKGDALYRLGHYYLHGHYYEYDIEKCISFFERASKCGTYRYQPELYLALIYNHGEYGVCDYDKSLAWLVKGSERCSALKYLLGEVYKFGVTHFLVRLNSINTFKFNTSILAFSNIEKDTCKAYQLFYEYFEGGYYIYSPTKINEYDIGVAFMDGTYFYKDYDKAFEYLSRSVPSWKDLKENVLDYKDEKTADALYRLSQMYRFGNGTMANEHRANQYLKYAALCGHQKAQSVISTKLSNEKN